MKIRAYQIVDFNNPISVKHHENSILSFKPVSDVVEIVPFQAITPNTLPQGKFFGDGRKRTVYEQACFCSHYLCMKKIASGKNIFIMEHDAYLWSDKIDFFYLMLDNYKKYEIFYLGIANEFYTASKQVAQRYCRLVDTGDITSGPMLHIGRAYLEVKTPLSKILWPVTGQKNLLCESNCLNDSSDGNGVVMPAPVTQRFSPQLGSTIRERKNKWLFSPENNPDMLFKEFE